MQAKSNTMAAFFILMLVVGAEVQTINRTSEEFVVREAVGNQLDSSAFGGNQEAVSSPRVSGCII